MSQPKTDGSCANELGCACDGGRAYVDEKQNICFCECDGFHIVDWRMERVWCTEGKIVSVDEQGQTLGSISREACQKRGGRPIQDRVVLEFFWCSCGGGRFLNDESDEATCDKREETDTRRK